MRPGLVYPEREPHERRWNGLFWSRLCWERGRGGAATRDPCPNETAPCAGFPAARRGLVLRIGARLVQPELRSQAFGEGPFGRGFPNGVEFPLKLFGDPGVFLD